MSMKTKGRSCKIGEKRTGFRAQLTRILQKKSSLFALLKHWERMMVHEASETRRQPCGPADNDERRVRGAPGWELQS